MRNLKKSCVRYFIILWSVQMSHTLSFLNSSKPFCQRSDHLALLDLKRSLTIDTSASQDCLYQSYFITGSPGGQIAKAKTKSWKRETYCCEWDGVTCHPSTGYVIGLDLSCAYLSGNLWPNSTLFQLRHLQTLNLAFNDFRSSDVSASFGLFPHLTYLNLSNSAFQGKFPSEITHLRKVTSLDLSSNGLEISNFKDIVENLTAIKQLVLEYNSISSPIPVSLLNRSALASLSLAGCSLQGELPFSILKLPQLKVLNLGYNPHLYIDVQLGNWSNSLEVLNLNFINLSSQLPSSLGHSMHLRQLCLHHCNLHGTIPSWVWNITESIELGGNHLTGSLPSVLPNVLSLVDLDLSSNNLSGTTKLNMFSESKALVSLFLSNSGLSIIVNSEFNSTLIWPQLEFLSLSSCNITAFPILRPPMYLRWLDLSNNNIQGRVPTWLLDIDRLIDSNDLGLTLNLSHNSLTQGLENLPWEILSSVDISSNMLQEPIPKFPKNRIFDRFLASNNKLNGIIDPSICHLTQIGILDLSRNVLVGEIPRCLGNIISVIAVLDLKSNRLNGSFQIELSECNSLAYLDLSDNGLEGIVPKSLSKCSSLNVLNLGNNKFQGAFPSWLDSFPKLQALKLGSNKFHGPLSTSSTVKHPFPMLQIFDLSDNEFSGQFPTRYLKNFRAMMDIDESKLATPLYMVDKRLEYTYSIVLVFNGRVQLYSKIIITMSTFDLSNNNFGGEIPDAIGKLHALRGLNISHNLFKGSIPPSIGMLTLLDCLDLSSNMLTGPIPEELISLTSLGVFNVSDNLLEGPIPHGQQFGTFSIESYQRNPELCGKPLLDCGANNSPSTNSTKDNEDGFKNESILQWQIIMMGFGSGVLTGLAWGYYMFSVGKPYRLIIMVNKMELALLDFRDDHFGRCARGARTRRDL